MRRFFGRAMAAAFLCFGGLRGDPATALEPNGPLPPPAGGLCQPAILAAQKASGLAAGLLTAIGLVESGRVDPATGKVVSWPWTINANGEGQFFDTKEEAVAAVRALQAKGVRSIDVGCVQVNLMHHPRAFATLEHAFDPVVNAAYGGRYLRSLYGGLGGWPEAAAAYHSQTPTLANAYRELVMARWPGAPPSHRGLNFDVYGAWPPPGVAYAAIPPPSFAYGPRSAPAAKPYSSSVYLR